MGHIAYSMTGIVSGSHHMARSLLLIAVRALLIVAFVSLATRCEAGSTSNNEKALLALTSQLHAHHTHQDWSNSRSVIRKGQALLRDASDISHESRAQYYVAVYYAETGLQQTAAAAQALHSATAELLRTSNPQFTSNLIRLAIEGYEALGLRSHTAPLFARHIEIAEKHTLQGPDDLHVFYNNLTALLNETGRPIEAARYARRAVDLALQRSPIDLFQTVNTLRNAQIALRAVDDAEGAESLFRKSLDLCERFFLKPADKSITTSATASDTRIFCAEQRADMAAYFAMLRRTDESLQHLDAAIEFYRASSDDRDPAQLLTQKATTLLALGRAEEALPLLDQAIGAYAAHGYVNASYPSAALYFKGRALQKLLNHERALKAFHQSAQIAYPVGLASHFAHAKMLEVVSLIRLGRNEVAEKYLKAVDDYIAQLKFDTSALRRRSSALHIELALLSKRYAGVDRLAADLANDWQPDLDSDLTHGDAYSVDVIGRVDRDFVVDAYFRAISELRTKNAAGNYALDDESWRIAQFAYSSVTSRAIREGSVKMATAGTPVGETIRELRDLEREELQRQQALRSLLAVQPALRNRAEVTSLEAGLQKLQTEIRKKRGELDEQFPQLASLFSEAKFDLARTRAALAPDELLVKFVETNEKVIAFAVTTDAAVWRPIELSRGKLFDMVQSLRCGLDASAWAHAETAEICAYSADKVAGWTPNDDVELPFDLRTAFDLYSALFGGFEERLAKRKLILIASGRLSQVPLGALITESSTAKRFFNPADRTPSWLAAKHSLTYFPTVSAMVTLRAPHESRSEATTYVAFANPLLTGKTGLDKRAWSAGDCSRSAFDLHTDVRRTGIDGSRSRHRGAMANIEDLRKQEPLPQTVAEVCNVAHSLTGLSANIVLGENATEAKLKELSKSGDLQNARVLHLATHGLKASETATFINAVEPSIVMTPPTDASGFDDGLLTESEIVGLRLNADAVILSACNTASATDENGETFSGLAKAFFAAGARSILASHWYVDNAATVELISSMFGARGEGRAGSHGEALQMAVRKAIAAGSKMAHPAAWSAFTLVGDGRFEN